MQSPQHIFNYLDLFAGCGGLSLGLEAAGGKLVLAVEKSPMAAETFTFNLLPEEYDNAPWSEYLLLPVPEQIKKRILVGEVGQLLTGNGRHLQELKSKTDVIVGGPPCQGFSLAGRRNADDPRNLLPNQFLEIVDAVDPKIVLMENVLGMRSAFSSDKQSTFSEITRALEIAGNYGYEVQQLCLNAKHYGAPQSRPRLMLLGVRRDVSVSLGLKSSGSIWYSDYLDSSTCKNSPPLAPKPTIESDAVRTLQDAIWDLTTNGRKPLDSSPIDYSSTWGVLKDRNLGLQNLKLRNHGAVAVERFRLYQWLANLGISSKFLNQYAVSLEDSRGKLVQDLVQYLPAVSPDGHLLAETKTDLLLALERTITRKHSQRVLRWREPSFTVVTNPDDLVHPDEPRTFSVRELARVQGFPDLFVFRSKETTGGTSRRTEVPQYSQVGNAVSPLLAREIGHLISGILSRTIAAS